MKTSKQTILLFMTCFALCYSLQAQHTEIEHNSTGTNPQLLLTETSSSFGRLTMKNQEKGEWTLAARNGPGTDDDDFNIYYDDATSGYNVLNIDADSENLNFTARAMNLFGRTNHATFNIDTDDTNDDARLVLRSSTDAWSIAADGGFNRMTMSAGSQRFLDVSTSGDAAFQATPIDGTTLVVGGQGPHLKVRENNNSGYAQLQLGNFAVDDNWNIEANAQFVNTNLASSNKADFNIRFDDEDGVKQDLLTILYGVDAFNGAKRYRMGVFEPAPDADLHISHRNNSVDGGLKLENRTGGNWWKFYANSGSNIMTLRNSTGAGTVGTFAANGTYTASDLRLKKNIESMPYSIAQIQKLNAKSYHYKSDKDSDLKSIGFIAQEVKEVVPELVLYDVENDQYSLNYGGLSVLAIQAIQEQQIIIEDLQKEMASQKILINKLASKK